LSLATACTATSAPASLSAHPDSPASSLVLSDRTCPSARDRRPCSRRSHTQPIPSGSLFPRLPPAAAAPGGPAIRQSRSARQAEKTSGGLLWAHHFSVSSGSSPV